MLSARLILVRHGQSTYNAQLRLQGQADPPLSETGREEARALADALPRFAQVVTSDLARASETAYSWRGGSVAPAGGESWPAFQRRVGGAVDELVRAGGTWLVVCHGGVVRAALSHVTGADPQKIAGPANTSVTVIRAGTPPRLERYAWTPGMSAT